MTGLPTLSDLGRFFLADIAHLPPQELQLYRIFARFQARADNLNTCLCLSVKCDPLSFCSAFSSYQISRRNRIETNPSI